jgi:hypothetical protein
MFWNAVHGVHSEFLCCELLMGGSDEWIVNHAGGRHVQKAKQKVIQIFHYIIFFITTLQIHVFFYGMVLCPSLTMLNYRTGKVA